MQLLVYSQQKVAEMHVLASSCLSACDNAKTDEWIFLIKFGIVEFY
jgi:hypothetical protein